MIRLIFFDLEIYICTLLVDHKTTKSLDSCLERWIELKLYNDVTQNDKSLFYMMFEEDLNDWISRVVQGLKVCMCMKFKGQLSCHHIQNKRQATGIHYSIIYNNKCKLLNHGFPFHFSCCSTVIIFFRERKKKSISNRCQKFSFLIDFDDRKWQ